MNSTSTTCNYALLRYLPYPETGEFVNVGILVACAEPVVLGFWMDSEETFARVSALFPEVDRSRFEAAHAAMGRELERVRTQVREARDTKAAQRFFKELVRPRESSFRFGEIRTTTSRNPEGLAEELFMRYVLRILPPAMHGRESSKG